MTGLDYTMDNEKMTMLVAAGSLKALEGDYAGAITDYSNVIEAARSKSTCIPKHKHDTAMSESKVRRGEKINSSNTKEKECSNVATAMPKSPSNSWTQLPLPAKSKPEKLKMNETLSKVKLNASINQVVAYLESERSFERSLLQEETKDTASNLENKTSSMNGNGSNLKSIASPISDTSGAGNSSMANVSKNDAAPAQSTNDTLSYNWPSEGKKVITENVLATIEHSHKLQLKRKIIAKRLLYFLNERTLNVYAHQLEGAKSVPKLKDVALFTLAIMLLKSLQTEDWCLPQSCLACQEILPPFLDKVPKFRHIQSDYPLTVQVLTALIAFFKTLPLSTPGNELATITAKSKQEWVEDLPVVNKIPNIDSSTIPQSTSDASSKDALLYYEALAKRAYCYLRLDMYCECIDDCDLYQDSPVAATLSQDCSKLLYLYKAQALYQRALRQKEEANKTNHGSIPPNKTAGENRILYEEASLDFRNAAFHFAKALELFGESEFNLEYFNCNIQLVISQYEVLILNMPGKKFHLKTCCLCWKNVENNLEDSHVYPRFVLKEIALGGKIQFQSKLKGINVLTWKMLCKECEGKFSNKGEVHFKRTFEDFMYKSPECAHKIAYNEWLHYLFISIMWRNLLINESNHISLLFGNFQYLKIRQYLLTGNPTHLPIVQSLHLYVDKHTHTDISMPNTEKIHKARKEIQFACDPKEYCLLHFWWFYALLPLGTAMKHLLWQDSLSLIQVAGGELHIPPEEHRNMPVFLERFTIKQGAELHKQTSAMVDKDYQEEQKLAGKSTITKEKSLSAAIKSMEATTENIAYDRLEEVWLPSDCKFEFKDDLKYGLALSGKDEYSVLSRIVVKLINPSIMLWLCTFKGVQQNSEKKVFAILRFQMSNDLCSSLYFMAFDFDFDGTVVSNLRPMAEIKNKRQLLSFLSHQDDWKSLEDNVAYHLQIILDSLNSEKKQYFLPKDLKVTFNPLNIMGATISEPWKIHVGPIVVESRPHFYSIWLCLNTKGETIALYRFVKPVEDETGPPLDCVVSFGFDLQNGLVKNLNIIDSIREDVKKNSVAHDFAFSKDPVYVDMRLNINGAIEILCDPSFQKTGVLACIPGDWQFNFHPIDEPGIIKCPGFYYAGPVSDYSEKKVKMHAFLFINEGLTEFRVIQKFQITGVTGDQSCISIWIPRLDNLEPTGITSDISISDERYRIVKEILENAIQSKKIFYFTLFSDIRKFLEARFHSLVSSCSKKEEKDKCESEQTTTNPKKVEVDLLKLSVGKSLHLLEQKNSCIFPKICGQVRGELTSKVEFGLQLSNGYSVYKKPIVSHPFGAQSKLRTWLCHSHERDLLAVNHFVLPAYGINIMFAISFQILGYEIKNLALITQGCSTPLLTFAYIFTKKFIWKSLNLLMSQSMHIIYHLPQGCTVTHSENEYGIDPNGFKITRKPIRNSTYSFWLCKKDDVDFLLFSIQQYLPSPDIPFSKSFFCLQFDVDGNTQTIKNIRPLALLEDEQKDIVYQSLLDESIYKYTNPYPDILTTAIELMLRPHYCTDSIQRYIPTNLVCYFDSKSNLIVSDEFSAVSGPTLPAKLMHGIFELQIRSWLCAEKDKEAFCLCKIHVTDHSDLLFALKFRQYSTGIANIVVCHNISNTLNTKGCVSILDSFHIVNDLVNVSTPIGQCIYEQISFLVMESRKGTPPQLMQPPGHVSSHPFKVKNFLPPDLMKEFSLDPEIKKLEVKASSDIKVVKKLIGKYIKEEDLVLWILQISTSESLVVIQYHESNSSDVIFAIDVNCKDGFFNMPTLRVSNCTITSELVVLFAKLKGCISALLFRETKKDAMMKMHLMPKDWKTDIEHFPVPRSKNFAVLGEPVITRILSAWLCQAKNSKKNFILVKVESDGSIENIPKCDFLFLIDYKSTKGPVPVVIEVLPSVILSVGEVAMLKSICFEDFFFGSTNPIPNLLLDIAKILVTTNYCKDGIFCFTPIGISLSLAGNRLTAKGTSALAGPHTCKLQSGEAVDVVTAWLCEDKVGQRQCAIHLKSSLKKEKLFLFNVCVHKESKVSFLELPYTVDPYPTTFVPQSLLYEFISTEIPLGKACLGLLKTLEAEHVSKGAVEPSSSEDAASVKKDMFEYVTLFGKQFKIMKSNVKSTEREILYRLPYNCVAEYNVAPFKGLVLYQGFSVLIEPLKLHDSDAANDATLWICKTPQDNEFGIVLHSTHSVDVFYAVYLEKNESDDIKIQLTDDAEQCTRIVELFNEAYSSLQLQAMLMLSPERAVLKIHCLPLSCVIPESLSCPDLAISSGVCKTLGTAITLPDISAILCVTDDQRQFVVFRYLLSLQEKQQCQEYDIAIAVDFVLRDGEIVELTPFSHLTPEQMSMVTFLLIKSEANLSLKSLVQVLLNPSFQKDGIQRYLPRGCICTFAGSGANDLDDVILNSPYSVTSGPYMDHVLHQDVKIINYSLWLCGEKNADSWGLLKLRCFLLGRQPVTFETVCGLTLTTKTEGNLINKLTPKVDLFPQLPEILLEAIFNDIFNSKSFLGKNILQSFNKLSEHQLPEPTEIHHSKTKQLNKFTAFDFGPLNVLPGKEVDNDIVKSFRGGSYLQTTPGKGGITLYRLYDEVKAAKIGQFWTVDEREGNASFQMDTATKYEWNKLTKKTNVHIPEGIFLYEGPSEHQTTPYFGGGWQVFIPYSVLEPLMKRQELLETSSILDKSAEKQIGKMAMLLNEALMAQVEQITRYQKERDRVMAQYTKRQLISKSSVDGTAVKTDTQVKGEHPQDGSPTDDREHPLDGSPADDRERPQDGSPADDREHPQDGSPTDDREHPQDGSPADDREHPQDGSPADDREHPLDGSPADDREQPLDGSPADDREQPLDGSPADDMHALD